MVRSELKERILSRENIYNAVYAVDSFIAEKNLLTETDIKTLHSLKDQFDFKGVVTNVVEECKRRLNKILSDPTELFEVSVFFKIKKLSDDDNPKVEYRPLHTACLHDQICMAALLMPLMFDDTSGKRQLSELSQMLPHNFYGNIPSCDVGRIFCDWQEKYREYSQTVNDKCRIYSKTREYDTEISYDLKDFFPSIDPLYIFNFIWSSLVSKYKEKEDQDTLKTLLTKLLYFRIKKDNLRGWEADYYKNNVPSGDINGYYPARGIAQGLPQSYFFGNLCMIKVGHIITHHESLDMTDACFYVDDSVVFTRNINVSSFNNIVKKLNEELAKIVHNENNTVLEEEYRKSAEKISYQIQLHKDGKSSICDIDDSFRGMEGLFHVQRTVSMGGWIKGNLDEVDDNVALKKLKELIKLIDGEIEETRTKKKRSRDKDALNGVTSREKWLTRYRRYFLFREKQLEILLNGEYKDKFKKDFYSKFSIIQIINEDKLAPEQMENLFLTLDEDIFQAEFEILLRNMPFADRKEFCNAIQKFDMNLSNYNTNSQRNTEFLYYHQIAKTLDELLLDDINPYRSLEGLIKRTKLLRNPEKFISDILKKGTGDDVWENLSFMKPIILKKSSTTNYDSNTFIPEWCGFVFHNSENFKRQILNCCLSLACNIPPSDNLSILRNNIKPIRYFELRLLTILRNHRFRYDAFQAFIHSLDLNNLTERMEIDLSLLETIGIFRQRVHDPAKIDRLIQVHRLVKSLWHNGSKFLNAYTLHNHEHAVNLIKNVVRIINNVDFLNLKSNDYFLLFTACYLHDISMVIHPDIVSFNDGKHKADALISKWIEQYSELNEQIDSTFNNDTFNPEALNKLRKRTGNMLIETFKDIFDFFEAKMRDSHTADSAHYIRQWQSSLLSFLSELEADTIANISESHGWDTADVYGLKSKAKEELISLKYMMILIRLADLLDLANDRIDYYILKQNRPQMNLTSRYHWISHLITDKYELDVDYKMKTGTKLNEHPLKENIHLDIFLNTEIMTCISTSKGACEGFIGNIKKRKQERVKENGIEKSCIEFQVGLRGVSCKSSQIKTSSTSKSCPFLCRWMSDKHKWLLSELGKLKHYLNSVNSDLIESDIVVRFFYENASTLDSEFYDDIKEYLEK